MIYPIVIRENIAYIYKDNLHVNYIKNVKGLAVFLIKVTDFKILRRINEDGYYATTPLNIPHIK